MQVHLFDADKHESQSLNKNDEATFNKFQHKSASLDLLQITPPSKVEAKAFKVIMRFRVNRYEGQTAGGQEGLPTQSGE